MSDEDRALLTNFRTTSMTTGGAGQLEHKVAWDSTSGDLADLADVFTREHVTWEAAPDVFGAKGPYTSAGDHYGLGENNATGGQTVDNHSIIPTEFIYRDIRDGEEAPVWTMTQEYEVRVGDGGWAPIEGATYEITRWYERQGEMLVAYCAKRGTGSDSSMHRAMVSLANYFEPEPEPEEQQEEHEQEEAQSSAASGGSAPAVEWDSDAVASRNESNIKDADEGDVLPVVCAGDRILIGDHPAAYASALAGGDAIRGTVKVKKGGKLFDTGSLTFEGLTKYSAEITEHVEGFSKKKVVFA